MKIFKLTYVALILAVAGFTSCSKDYGIEEADKAVIEASNGFEFPDEINNYIINGKLTYDRKEIADAAKDAWNIHYDYPHNKVVISTTPTEFKKYQNSSDEIKKVFMGSSENVEEKALETYGNKTSINTRATALNVDSTALYVEPTALDLDFNKYYVVNHTNHLKYGYVVNLGSGFSYVHFLLSGNNPDCTGYVNVWKATNANLGVSQLTPEYKHVCFAKAQKTEYYAQLNNHSGSTKSITFYEKINYTGVSKTYTVGGNIDLRVINHASFNIGLSTMTGARSYKVT